MKRNMEGMKGFAQTDYIIAIGLFILIFALVIQYVSGYFSSVGDLTNARVMSSQATSLLDLAERGYEPASWPYTNPNSSVVLTLHLDNSTIDSSLYGNNGTRNGANCSANVAGKLDSGCSFDGIDDFIQVNDQANINFSAANSFSAGAWVNPQAAAGGSWAVIGKQKTATSAGWRLFLNTASRELMTMFSDGTNTLTLTSGNNVSNNSWSHVAVTIDRSGNVSSLYLNGIVVNNSANISSVGSLQNTQPARIGSINAAQYFNGSIDEVAIYNRSLNESEIYTHWAYENLLDRIGLYSRAYRFTVVVNNSLSYWKNQSQTVETIGNEQVSLNFTEIGYGANIPSVYILESNGSRVGYEISGNTVTFRTAISANSAKTFTVYFDDDSNFVEQTQSITGVDNLSEVIEPVQSISLIQNRKMQFLTNSNYTRMKNASGLPRDFGIRMNDVDANNNVLDFGPPEPPSGNVVAYRRFALYQNATGAVRKARVTIQIW